MHEERLLQKMSPTKVISLDLDLALSEFLQMKMQRQIKSLTYSKKECFLTIRYFCPSSREKTWNETKGIQVWSLITNPYTSEYTCAPLYDVARVELRTSVSSKGVSIVASSNALQIPAAALTQLLL